MLAAAEPRFEYLLYPGERIEFVTKGRLNASAFEQYFMALWSGRLNWSIILLTNYRVLFLNTGSRRGGVKSLMWQIPYDRIRKYRGGVNLGVVSFGLNDKKTYRFISVRRQDRKHLKEYVEAQRERVQNEEFKFPSYSGRDSLCPRCATPARKESKQCKGCNAQFMRPSVPALMSLFLPGLGSLYLGHRFIAVTEFLGFLFVLMVAAGTVASAYPASPSVQGADPAIAWATGAVIVVIANGFDALLAYFVAHKGMQVKLNAWKG